MRKASNYHRARTEQPRVVGPVVIEDLVSDELSKLLIGASIDRGPHKFDTLSVVFTNEISLPSGSQRIALSGAAFRILISPASTA